MQRIGKTGVHALSADGTHDVGGIAAEDDLAADVAFDQGPVGSEGRDGTVFALVEINTGGIADALEKSVEIRGIGLHTLGDPASPLIGQRKRFHCAAGGEIKAGIGAEIFGVGKVGHDKTHPIRFSANGDVEMFPGGAVGTVTGDDPSW